MKIYRISEFEKVCPSILDCLLPFRETLVVKKVTKEGDLSAKPLTSSNTIRLSLSTCSPIPFPICNDPFFFNFFSVEIFKIIKNFPEIIFVLWIQKIYLRNKIRIYFGFPLFGELDFRDPVVAFKLAKRRVTNHLLNEGHFSTCCTTQNQNISQNGTVVRAGLRICHAKIARSSSVNPK